MSNPYEPSAVDSEPAEPTPFVEIPGLEGRVSVTPPGMFSGCKILFDGTPLPMSWGKYTFPDGRVARLSQLYTRTLPTIVLDGQSYTSGEAVPIPLLVLQFLPFLLVGLGGCLGGAAGGAGVGVNMAINRQDWPTPAKIGAMVVVTFLSAVLWLLIAGTFTLMFADLG